MERSPTSLWSLPAAVARGAYEAGPLSVLLPVLEQRGERPPEILTQRWLDGAHDLDEVWQVGSI